MARVRAGNFIQKTLVFFYRFFADKNGFGKCLGDGCLDGRFGGFVGIGHQIKGRGFLADGAFAEAAVARHDFLIGGDCHDIGQPFQIFSCKCHSWCAPDVPCFR